MRIKFPKGEQRKFLTCVMKELNSPSLRNLLQYLVRVKYSTLKNYYSEVRCLPQDLFNDLCTLSKMNKENLKFEYLDENWGKVKGGKIGKRGNKRKK